MKKTSTKHTFVLRVKRFFKHYFGLFLLALACAALVTLVLFYALG